MNSRSHTIRNVGLKAGSFAQYVQCKRGIDSKSLDNVFGAVMRSNLIPASSLAVSD